MSIICYVRAGSKRRILAGETVHWVHNHKTRADYLLAVVLSAPLWVREAYGFELEALRAWAAAMSKFHGELYVLDHIVPTTHPRVCGLTVPWNLRVVHWLVNGSKGNDWNPDQGELFGDAEEAYPMRFLAAREPHARTA